MEIKNNSYLILFFVNVFVLFCSIDQNQKAATPLRRQSINQIGSPNAGTVVYRPSPTQSPAASASNAGAVGTEFNTTLVGSNNISLNKVSLQLERPQTFEKKNFYNNCAFFHLSRRVINVLQYRMQISMDLEQLRRQAALKRRRKKPLVCRRQWQ